VTDAPRVADGRVTEGSLPERRRAPGAKVSAWRMLGAQTAMELRLTRRRGESVLVTVLLPALLLVFFSTVPLLAWVPGEPPVWAVYPGVLAVAVMSTAMVSLGIATAFERQYGVLKRLGGSPLPRPALVGAKVISVLVVEVFQVVLLTALALVLGWRPPAAGASLPLALLALVLGTVAFGGLGLWMAGSWRAEAALAGANGLYLILLFLGGVFVPPDRLPWPIGPGAALLPSAALAGVLRFALSVGAGSQSAGAGLELLVLGLWAVGACVLAVVTFKWE
jgi:ABC-2 type transport system permease protein